MADIQIPGFPDNLVLKQVTILNGASASEIIPTQGLALVGIRTPATWTAADIGYKAGIQSANAAALVTVYNGGGIAYTTVATASKHIAFPTSDALFVPFLQIQSVVAGGGSVTPANQAQDTVLLLLFRKFLS